MIAAIQNVRILLAHQKPKYSAAIAVMLLQLKERLQPSFVYPRCLSPNNLLRQEIA